MNNSNVIKKMKIALEVDTNEQLANKLNTTKSTVDSWSKRPIAIKYLLQIVNLTGVTIEWLTSDDKPIFNVSGGVGQMNGDKQIGIQNFNLPTKLSKKDEQNNELIKDFISLCDFASSRNTFDVLNDEFKTWEKHVMLKLIK